MTARIVADLRERTAPQTGTRDLSSIGESDRYPVGFGCEACS
jgi:hypothetical protein